MIPTEKLAEVATQEMKSNDRIDLERALNRLKPKYRHVVLLKYYNDMTTIEIAKVLKNLKVQSKPGYARDLNSFVMC